VFKNFILPVSLISSAIIGAGMFSLPYVFNESGFGLGWVFLIILTIVTVFIHLLYGDIILRTDGHHNFVGYARIYLGDWWARLAILMSVIEMAIVLVVYLILSTSFFNLFFSPEKLITGVIVFWLLGSVVIFWSLKRMALLDFFIDLGIVLIVGIIFLKGQAIGSVRPLFSSFNAVWDFKNWFLPIGPILFAFSGRVAILEAIKYFLPEKPVLKIKRAIVWGTIIPSAIYALFIIGVSLLSNPITKDSVSGLANILPANFMVLVGILGILSLWSSYVAVGFDVHNILRVDLRLVKRLAALAVTILPLVLYFSGLNDFIFLISLIGGVFISLEGLFIIWIWLRLNKVSHEKPKLLNNLSGISIFLLILIFGVVLINEITRILN
jgi:amino acid permease